MKLKEFDMNTKTISLQFKDNEFKKFDISGEYLLSNENDRTESFKLVKRGKKEVTTYILLNVEHRKMLNKKISILKGQFIKNLTNTYLIIDLGKSKK